MSETVSPKTNRILWHGMVTYKIPSAISRVFSTNPPWLLVVTFHISSVRSLYTMMSDMSLHPYPKGGLTGCQISIVGPVFRRLPDQSEATRLFHGATWRNGEGTQHGSCGQDMLISNTNAGFLRGSRELQAIATRQTNPQGWISKHPGLDKQPKSNWSCQSTCHSGESSGALTLSIKPLCVNVCQWWNHVPSNAPKSNSAGTMTGFRFDSRQCNYWKQKGN